ncbi:hypothetical protein MHYP_G00245880 [Metynnis hypsauchen]
MALSAVPGLGEKIEGEQQMEDEFTCPGVLRGCLLDLKNTVERVFRVILTIGGEEDAYTSRDGQIWLQLKGRKIDIEAAKLFVKGVVNQEAQNEVPYPKNLHCVFSGARGLFIDCLIRITSAHIKVGSVGCLLVFGLAKPVVKACSLITGLADKYWNSLSEPIDIKSDSLDSRRTFKSLVERPEDSYTLDLLALPVVVKEALLDLVNQSGVGPSTLDSAAVSAGSRTLLELQQNIERRMHRKSTEHRTPDVLENFTFPGKQNGTFLSHTPRSDFSSKSQNYGIKNKEEQPREEKGLSGTSHSQFLHCSVGVSQHIEEQQESEQQEEEYLLSTGSKQEHEHLLKFFTAMGYDEQLVCRVLTRTGPREPSQHSKVSEQQIAQMENPAKRPQHIRGPPPSKTGAVVTGSQRFLESLEKPFDLQLTNTPGGSGLRQIIIDGSNVAMSHGLGMFFSCRGIALAVEYFWSRGHREITVLVPHWRQKKDPKIKEQHFLTQLQDLRLLSFTPSREVMGQRINSYDDRMMLQFAQQTDGVIVTNDNMRDLVDESGAWKEIIKKRLLQYLFAGDLFMVPDDPLGRSGPHLNSFLRKQNSSPALGSHSFAGVASSCSLPSPHPRAHTEVLQYRERTTGGTSRPKKSGRAPPKVEEKANRSAEETLRLKQELVQIFPGQESVVMMTLQCHPTVTDINDLSTFILEQQECINE